MQKKYNRFRKLKIIIIERAKKKKEKGKRNKKGVGWGGKLYRTAKAQCRGRGL